MHYSFIVFAAFVATQTCTSNFAIKDNNNNNLLSFNANNDMTVAASSYRYTTPVTGYLTVPSSSFIAEDPSVTLCRDNSYGPAVTACPTIQTASPQTTGYAVIAPLYLPQGANITNVDFSIYNNNGIPSVRQYNFSIWVIHDHGLGFMSFYPNTPSVAASLDNQTFPTGGTVFPFSLGNLNIPVDNSANVYYVRLSTRFVFDNCQSGCFSSNLNFYGVRVTYVLGSL